jgi:steroid delta-isomerase-like uncharacterized protein
MSAETNLAVLSRVTELINDRKLDEAVDFYDRDYVHHGPGGQELTGRDGIRRLWDLFLGAFPDLTASMEESICGEDKVALRFTVRGTHTAQFLGVPASNRSIILPTTEVFRIENGTLVEAWDQYDRLHLLEQIGGVPGR